MYIRFPTSYFPTAFKVGKYTEGVIECGNKTLSFSHSFSLKFIIWKIPLPSSVGLGRIRKR